MKYSYQSILWLLTAALAWSGCTATKPEEALRHFYSHNGPEDTLMDPLILAGREVVPLVLREVANREMPRRRYAIRFLGDGGYEEALPTLSVILKDESESDLFRADALASILSD